jgi:hypothetical protein
MFNLSEYMDKNKLSVSDIAKKINKSESYVKKLKSGDRKISIEMRKLITGKRIVYYNGDEFHEILKILTKCDSEQLETILNYLKDTICPPT